jgi:hypothetical protein
LRQSTKSGHEQLQKNCNDQNSGAEAPQSKRSATIVQLPSIAKRLECGVFTAAIVCLIARAVALRQIPAQPGVINWWSELVRKWRFHPRAGASRTTILWLCEINRGPQIVGVVELRPPKVVGTARRVVRSSPGHVRAALASFGGASVIASRCLSRIIFRLLLQRVGAMIGSKANGPKPRPATLWRVTVESSLHCQGMISIHRI